jgi:hypothetical protein
VTVPASTSVLNIASPRKPPAPSGGARFAEAYLGPGRHREGRRDARSRLQTLINGSSPSQKTPRADRRAAGDSPTVAAQVAEHVNNRSHGQPAARPAEDPIVPGSIINDAQLPDSTSGHQHPRIASGLLLGLLFGLLLAFAIERADKRSGARST